MPTDESSAESTGAEGTAQDAATGDAASAGATSKGDAEASAGAASDPPGGPRPASAADVEALRADVATLESTLADLRDELQGRDALAAPRRRGLLSPPRIGDLRRFTTEVSIPVAVLVLETNLQALRILQRALRAGGESGSSDSLGSGSLLGRGAADAGQRALARLDDALADLQSSAVASGGAGGSAVDDLLDEADRLRERVRSELEEMEAETAALEETARADSAPEGGGGTAGADTRTEVPVDVESELDSIRAEVDGTDEDE